MKCTLPKTLPSFIWFFLKQKKYAVIIFILVSICTGFLSPINSLLIKKIINLLPQISNGDTSLLFWPSIFVVLNFFIFDNLTWRTLTYINYKFQAVIKNQIIGKTLEHTLGKSHQFFQDNMSGSISKHITTLAENIENILHKISKNFIKAVTTLFIAFSLTYSVNPVFFYILIVWFFAFTIFSLFMSKHLVVLSNNHADSESALSGQIVDCISNNSNIRIFATKDYELSRMNTFFQKTQEAFSNLEFFIIIVDGMQGTMIATMLGSALYFLIKLYSIKLITAGDFALILGLSMDLAYCMWFTMFQVDEFNQALGKCKQSFNAIITSQEINKETTKELSVSRGQLVFNNVSFNYKKSKSIFQNLNVTINPSEKVGIVGYSGGGKSTFVNLILKLYDVSDGQILIDGQDISCITKESLRRNISMISQDPSLFNRRIIDNIKYGKDGATEEDVFQAAKKAHAHEFIIKLSNGYNSEVGERGLVLSGGQRQRISIARAILKNAPILILDEATSALDSITENLIQDSLWALMQNRTTIVIAHRLSTLLGMDRILVFDEGKIIQDGSHAKLISTDGLYKKLWDAQAGGFLPDTKI